MFNNLKIDFQEAEADFESNCALAQIIDKEDLETLYKNFKEVQFDSGDVIIRKGQTIKDLVYISKGVVHERNGDVDDDDAPKIKNEAGDILGLQFVAKNEGKSFTNCYAKTVCTWRIFPIEELIKLIKSREQESKLWNYVGPAIIYLNPNMFNRLQDLDPLQIKGLLKESTYLQPEKGAKISLENGGILFEGILEEIFDYQEDAKYNEESALSKSDLEFDRRRAFIRNYAFIYPNTSKYIVKSESRIYEFPSALKDTWLSFNPRVFAENINYLPSLQGHPSITMRNQAIHTLRKKEKTTLLGIPKGLAHNDPVRTFREGRRPNRGELYRIQNQEEQDGKTILPKGFTRRMKTKLPNDVEKNDREKENNYLSSEQSELPRLDTRKFDTRFNFDQSEQKQNSSDEGNSSTYNEDEGEEDEEDDENYKDNNQIDEEEEDSYDQSSY